MALPMLQVKAIMESSVIVIISLKLISMTLNVFSNSRAFWASSKDHSSGTYLTLCGSMYGCIMWVIEMSSFELSSVCVDLSSRGCPVWPAFCRILCIALANFGLSSSVILHSNTGADIVCSAVMCVSRDDFANLVI